MKQIVVVSDNRVGVIADISRLLSDAGINIERLDTSGTESHGAVVITTDNYDEALSVLKEASFTAVTEDAFVIRLKDEPGSLAKVAERFKNADINIRSMHIVKRDGDYTIVALAAEKTDQARKLIEDVLIA